MRNICESPSWVIYEKYLGNMLEIFVGAQNSLWACIGILVSVLMKLGLEKLYLNTSNISFLIFHITINTIN